MERGSRTRLTTLLVLVVVFAAGVLLGLAWRGTAPGAAAGNEAVAGAAPETTGDSTRTPMYEQVGPTPEQKILIDSIVRNHREAMKQLHAEFRAAYEPRYRALIESTREAIKGVLTPEQAAAYDSLLAAWDRKRAERESKRGGN